MAQIVNENKSLWRIKHKYIEDAGECEECKNFWKKMAEDKEAHVKELKELVKTHVAQ